MPAVLPRLGHDAAVYGLAMAAQKAVWLVLLPVYARSFTPSEYGQFEWWLSAAVLLGGFLMFGLDSATTLLLMRHGQSRAGRIAASVGTAVLAWIGLAAMVLLALVFLAPGSLGHGSIDRRLALVLLGCTPWLTLASFIANFFRWTHRRFAFLTVAVSQTLAAVCATVLLVPIGHFGVPGALMALGLGAGLAVAIGSALALSQLGERPNRAMMREAILTGLPFVAASALNLAQPLVLRSLLIAILGLRETGLFTAAYKLALALLLLSQAFSMAWGPMVLAKGEESADRRQIASVTSLLAAGLSVAGGCLVLLKPVVIPLMLGPAFAESGGVFAALVLAVAISAWRNDGLSFGLLRSERSKWIPAFSLGSIGLLMLFLPLGSRWLGLAGAAWALVLCEFSITIALILLLRKALPLHFDAAAAGRQLLLLAAVIALEAWLARGALSPGWDEIVRAAAMLCIAVLALALMGRACRVELASDFRRVRASL